MSEDFYRPTDVVNLLGDPTKARTKLGWDPMKTDFEELVRRMVASDMDKAAREGEVKRLHAAGQGTASGSHPVNASASDSHTSTAHS